MAIKTEVCPVTGDTITTATGKDKGFLADVFKETAAEDTARKLDRDVRNPGRKMRNRHGKVVQLNAESAERMAARGQGDLAEARSVCVTMPANWEGFDPNASPEWD